MINHDLTKNISYIVDEIGVRTPVVVKRIIIGRKTQIKGAIIYINELVDKNIIDRDILNPLLFNINDDILPIDGLCEYLCQRYIPMCNTKVEYDIKKAVEAIQTGKTAVLLDGIFEIIIADTTSGTYRRPSDPINESAIRGPRQGFTENLDANISVIKRSIKDKHLVFESFKVGKRTETDGALVYVDNIVDIKLVETIKEKINTVDVDRVTSTDDLIQYIEPYTYTIFPQAYGTERPDTVISNILDGRVAILLNGTPSVFTVPAFFIEFFQGVEDYYERTIVASFSRLIRLLCIFIVITFPSIYLTLVKFNAELIPVSFITPIVQSRAGIALTPFLEILTLEIIIEILREGGLRLPSKIAQTLSVVGGIIIGDTAVKSKIVSPTTLLILGITVVASFVIPSYHMSLVIRFLKFPMLLLSNVMGVFGIAVGWYFLLTHVSTLDSFGYPYFSLTKRDLKDFAIRAPLWQMDMRPDELNPQDKKRIDNKEKNSGGDNSAKGK